MGFFILAGLFAAAAGMSLTSDDDGDDDASVGGRPDTPPSSSDGNADDQNGSGTPGDDELSPAGRSTAHGLGGDDTLTASDRAIAHGDTGRDNLILSDRSTGYGGFGDDRLQGSDKSTAFGGDGDDGFTMKNESTAYGGAGDDNFRGTGNTTLSGDAGNDTLFFSADRSAGTGSLFGGSGNDRLIVTAGEAEGEDPAQAFGDDGDDVLLIRSGAHGFGGAGNDTLFSDDGGILTGGEGSDLFLASLLDLTATFPTSDTLTITDFDRATDRIQVDLNGIPASFTLSESGGDSTLTIKWQDPELDIPTSTIVIKGVTGLTLQDFTFSSGTAYPMIADFPPDPGSGIYDSVSQGGDAGEQLVLKGDQPLALMGAGNDSVTGGDGARGGLVSLGEGDDSFTDGGGRVVVYGGEGNDSYVSDGTESDGLTDRVQSDVFFGGAGDDSANLIASGPNAPPDSSDRSVRLDMGEGNDRVIVDRDFTSTADISTGIGDDTVSGWMGSTVYSGDGTDSVTFGIDKDHIVAGRDPAEIWDLSADDRITLDIDQDLTDAITTKFIPYQAREGGYTEIYVGKDRVAIIWDQNIPLDDPRLTINRGVTFA